VLIVDSVQAVHLPSFGAAPGTVGQVRGCAQWLVQQAKRRGCATLLVGHVTKDGGLAGPRTLEHVVDTVLSFEGDRHHALRLLRVVKHRFGSTSELGLFEMTDAGIEGVPDPSALFLADRCPGIAGSVVVPTLDGYRPLLVEVQALVSADAVAGSARRSAQGVDAGRLNLLIAVLGRVPGLRELGGHDVFASVAGGVKVPEPAADLGLALAVVSSWCCRPLGADLVAVGEVGLGGELRQVAQTPRRLAEAARLGLRRVLLPASAPEPPAGMRALRARNLSGALDAMFPDVLRGGSTPQQRRPGHREHLAA
jgi:DNA repair protein RadA/Sms